MHKVTNAAFESAWSDSNNRRIIYKASRRFYGQIPREELMFRGSIALYFCLLKHDPANKNKFTTSLYRHVKWQCLKALRKIEKQDRERNEPLSTEIIDGRQSFIDTLCVRDCIAQLPQQHRDIIRQYYYDKMTFREIGQLNGYTHVAAFQKLERAKDAFRRLYEAD